MASATSNSNSNFSNVSFVSAFSIIFGATELLERSVTAASTAFFTPSVSEVDSVSQVTIGGASQITVQGPPPSFTFPSGDSSTVRGAPPAASGLPRDNEGHETRRQILDRRRRECACEEVDVALAPVVKINVPFCFYPDQFKRFRIMFPRVNLDSGLSYTHHDHPVAHTATMVGIRKLQSLLQPGQLCLDLHGNPTGNEQYNRFQLSRLHKRPHLPAPPLIETLVEMKVSADAVRKVTKWGPQFTEDGVRRYLEHPLEDIPHGIYDVFLSVHTLYYYSMYEVCQLLNKHRGTTMHCLVNYAPQQTGCLYGGALILQEWWHYDSNFA